MKHVHCQSHEDDHLTYCGIYIEVGVPISHDLDLITCKRCRRAREELENKHQADE